MTNEATSGPGGIGAVSCQSSGTLGNGSTNYRTVGDVLNTSLPSTPRVSSGSDRLVPALVWPPAAETLVPGWHDTMNDVDCTFTLAADGKMRCLPTASTATILFTDDACKSPSVVAVLSDPSCIGLRRYARGGEQHVPADHAHLRARQPTCATSRTSRSKRPRASAARSPRRWARSTRPRCDVSQFVEGVSAVE